MASIHKPQPNPIMLSFFGIWILWGFGYQTVWMRLMTSVEGTIIFAQDIPSPLAPARHGTEYTLRDLGGKLSHYVAGTTDASLPRDIPPGTYIKKRRWHLSYERDGQQVSDFCIPCYGATLSAVVGILVWAAKLNSRVGV